MKGYKMNFATKTITITKAFGERAAMPNSAEANLLQHLNRTVPGLKIAYKTHLTKKPNPYKGLNYRNMREYINYHENSAELMNAFETITSISKLQKSPHSYVRKWFTMQFPDYKEVPVLKNGMIAAVPVITDAIEEKIKNINTDCVSIEITGEAA